MERQFVIECDSRSNVVFVREVTRNYSSTVNYHHEAGAEILVSGHPDPEFYGKLDALLVTRDRIQNAPPITPGPPQTESIPAVEVQS